MYPFARSNPGGVIITLPYLTPSARVSSLELTALHADCTEYIQYNTERQPTSTSRIWSCRAMSSSFPAGRFQAIRHRRSNRFRAHSMLRGSYFASLPRLRTKLDQVNGSAVSHEFGCFEERSNSARESRAANADAGWHCCSMLISLMIEATCREGKGVGSCQSRDKHSRKGAEWSVIGRRPIAFLWWRACIDGLKR